MCNKVVNFSVHGPKDTIEAIPSPSRKLDTINFVSDPNYEMIMEVKAAMKGKTGGDSFVEDKAVSPGESDDQEKVTRRRNLRA